MATLFTPNYKLDLYSEDDRPNLRDQYNAAMGKIDTELKTLADAAPSGDFAPKNHASSKKDYGIGNASNFGHVRVIDGLVNYMDYDASTGYTVSPKEIVTQLKNGAPKYHASKSSEYGAASTSLYGHVITTDTITADGAYYQSTVPTEKAVINYVASAGGGSWTKTVNVSTLTTFDVSGISGSYTLSVYINNTLKLGLFNIYFGALNHNNIGSSYAQLTTIPSASAPNEKMTATLFYNNPGEYTSTRQGAYLELYASGQLAIWAQGTDVATTPLTASMVYPI